MFPKEDRRRVAGGVGGMYGRRDRSAYPQQRLQRSLDNGSHRGEGGGGTTAKQPQQTTTSLEIRHRRHRRHRDSATGADTTAADDSPTVATPNDGVATAAAVGGFYDTPVGAVKSTENQCENPNRSRTNAKNNAKTNAEPMRKPMETGESKPIAHDHSKAEQNKTE